MKTSALALVVTAVLATAAPAQPEPFVRPLPPAAAGTEALGRFLHELGYAPKALSPDVYQVTVQRDRWPVHVMLSLSTDGRRIWLESKFAPIEDPENVPPQAWKKLLEANDKIGPAHFAFDKSDRRIHLYKSFDNQTVTVARLKAELEQFDLTVRKTQDYWRGDNFKAVIASTDPTLDPGKVAVPTAKGSGAAASTNLPDPPSQTADFGPTNVQELKGEWSVTEIQLRGRKTPDEALKQRRPTVNFLVGTGGYDLPTGKTAGVRVTAEFRLGSARSRTVGVRFPSPIGAGPAGSPMTGPVDFVDEDGRVEEGTYQLDGDILKIAFAAPGEPRPADFKSTEQSKTTSMVLKKAK